MRFRIYHEYSVLWRTVRWPLLYVLLVGALLLGFRFGYGQQDQRMEWDYRQDPARPATGYQLERCTTPGCANFQPQGARLPLQPQGTTDTTTEYDTSYTYRLRAMDAQGRSSLPSNSVSVTTASAPQVPFDVVYVSAPRPNATQKMRFPDVFTPLNYDPGTHIMLLRSGSATPELLVDAGPDGAAFDPIPDHTGTYLYYVMCLDVRNRNPQKRNLPRGNCDIYKFHLPTRVRTQLTHSEYTPLAASPQTTQALGHGVFSTGPAPLPGGRLAFVSNRNGLMPNKEFTDDCFQLFILDEATGITEQIGYLNLGSALHPFTMTDGRLLFSSYETQGVRDHPSRGRVWGLWLIKPDGSGWEPAWSAYQYPLAAHWHGQKSDGKIVSTLYYNLHLSGFGGVLQFPYFSLGSMLPFMRFGQANPASNPALALGARTTWRFPFQPGGMTSLTPFGEPADFPSAQVGGQYVGKVSHPSGAPGNSVLLTWSGPGPTQRALTPTIDAGIYLLPAGVTATHPNQLQLVVNDPTRNEMQAKAMVPYFDIYGIPEPATLPWLPQAQHVTLKPGTPYGLIGTSSFYKRDSAAGQGVDYFNLPANPLNFNWLVQGSDAGKYTNDDIHAVRIVVLEPTAQTGASKLPHTSHMNERGRILGDDIPLRKPGAPRDPDGSPDTSFLARIPADVPFTFQMVDQLGQVLTMAQTWHQVRPGEVRTDCGGCHAHSQQGTDFARTVAGQPGYAPFDLTTAPVKAFEYVRDVRPLLARACVGCHSTAARAGALVLDNTALVATGLPRDYATLAADPAALYGRKPLVGGPAWRDPNASAYVRKLQARRSLLMWKLHNRRLDGYGNGDRADDIDFISAGCQAHLALTDAEKRTMAMWIDTGAGYGAAWDDDALPPTMTLHDAGTALVLGMRDVDSGLDLDTLAILHNGAPRLATALGDGRWSLTRAPGKWQVTVADTAGNRQTRALVIAAPSVTAGQLLHERCLAPLANWSMLTPVQQATWEGCVP